LRVADKLTEPGNKIVPVLVIGKYASALNSANDYMTQGTGRIDSGFTGHTALVLQTPIEGKL
jgi:hypothetical protein